MLSQPNYRFLLIAVCGSTCLVGCSNDIDAVAEPGVEAPAEVQQPDSKIVQEALRIPGRVRVSSVQTQVIGRDQSFRQFHKTDQQAESPSDILSRTLDEFSDEDYATAAGLLEAVRRIKPVQPSAKITLILQGEAEIGQVEKILGPASSVEEGLADVIDPSNGQEFRVPVEWHTYGWLTLAVHEETVILVRGDCAAFPG